MPKNWKLLPIENLSEQQVAQTLGHSSIFLSFSDQEGFALPPLEAALSGALVIGYTGQGAREYFNSPNFIEIQNGDFKSFFKAVVSSMSEIDNGLLKSEAFLTVIRKLRDLYGRDSELKHLLLFAKAVEQDKKKLSIRSTTLFDDGLNVSEHSSTISFSKCSHFSFLWTKSRPKKRNIQKRMVAGSGIEPLTSGL